MPNTKMYKTLKSVEVDGEIYPHFYATFPNFPKFACCQFCSLNIEFSIYIHEYFAYFADLRFVPTML